MCLHYLSTVSTVSACPDQEGLVMSFTRGGAGHWTLRAGELTAHNIVCGLELLNFAIYTCKSF